MSKNLLNWAMPPTENIKLEDCEWYHKMEVPNVSSDNITPSVSFDIRDDIHNILGNLDYKNKKVLNLGSITGHLSFEAERRGADVTSIDLSVDLEQMNKSQVTERDWVPRANDNWKHDLRTFMLREVKRRNAFWFAHKALKSKSRLLISHANNLPKELETHDIGIIFSVLLHIRDPFLALLRMCSHVNEKIVITELGGYPTYFLKFLPPSTYIKIKNNYEYFKRNNKFIKNLPNFIRKRFFNEPTLRFLPNFDRTASKWWAFNPDTIIAMLNVLGFGKTTVNYHYYKHVKGDKLWNFTVVGERTIPMEKCDYDYSAY